MMITKKLDVMLGDRYVGTINFKFSTLFPLTEEDFDKAVLEKYPTLRGKDWHVEPCG